MLERGHLSRRWGSYCCSFEWSLRSSGKAFCYHREQYSLIQSRGCLWDRQIQPTYDHHSGLRQTPWCMCVFVCWCNKQKKTSFIVLHNLLIFMCNWCRVKLFVKDSYNCYSTFQKGNYITITSSFTDLNVLATTPSVHSWDTGSNCPKSCPMVTAFGLITL